MKKDGLGEYGEKIFNDLKYDFNMIYEDKDSIGIINALVPYSDPRMLQFAKNSFLKSLLDEMKLADIEFFRQIKLPPNWLNHNDSKNLQEWVILFKKYFKFVGGEIVNEFLMSSGYLKGAHEANCSIFPQTLNKQPNWLKYENNN